jgi:hypothetical protein
MEFQPHESALGGAHSSARIPKGFEQALSLFLPEGART